MRCRPFLPLTVTAALLLAVFGGCSTTRRITNSTNTGLQQLLTTEAVDRALAKMSFPNLGGRSVYVEVGAPADCGEKEYLRRAVAAKLAEAGATVAHRHCDADYLAT
ncbi:MAG TPA: hypothetical protein VEB21_14215, partial [Terriglobales bacterium]|nr:hypothetical protein [Terriglobales bacterium]